MVNPFPKRTGGKKKKKKRRVRTMASMIDRLAENI